MISCDTVKGLLTDYIDQSLNGEAVAQIDNHLSQCPSCQKIYADVQYLTLRLKNTDRLRVSEDFDRNLRSRILNMDANPARKGFSVRGLSFGFSGAVVVAAVSFFVLNQFSGTISKSSINPQQTITRAQPFSAPSIQSNRVPVKESALARKEIKNDSLKNNKETVDKSKIKLVEQ